MDQRVEIYGTSRHDLNGKRGVATDFHWYSNDHSRDRYTVLLDSGAQFKVPRGKLRAENWEQIAPLWGMRVQIHGAVRQASQRGVAVGPTPCRSGYEVLLDSGETLLFQRGNVRAEAGSARPKAKGKGKKKGRE